MGMKSIRVMAVAFGFAAMSSMAETPEAQVYDVCLSLRTTGAASANLSHKDNPFLENTDKEYVVYRKPTNIEWRGLIWGCNCEALDGVWEEVNAIGETGISSVKGCVIWDSTTKKPVYIGKGSNLGDASTVPGTGFGWDFINAIGRDGTAVEACWTMVQHGSICEDTEWEEEGAELFRLQGAGFGKLSLNTYVDDDWRGVDCTSHVLYMVGKVSGCMKAPYKTKDTDWSGCTFCGYAPIAGSCDPAAAWHYCDCIDLLDECYTAVRGTWTVKYNEELSKMLSKTPAIKDGEIQDFIVSIRQVYNFPEAVAAGILAVELQIWEFDPTGCDELATALALAKQNTYAKEQAVEAVKYENLKAAEVKAAAELETAEQRAQAALDSLALAQDIYDLVKAEAYQAAYNMTNIHATVIYKNASGDAVTNNVVGCAAITAAINKFEIYTLVKMETWIPGYKMGMFPPGYNVHTSETWAECRVLVVKLWEAKAAADKAFADAGKALEAAKANVITTRAEVEKAQDALTAAQNDLGNINLLQWKAVQQLEKAEAALEAAQKAYDEAGCCD